MLKYMQMPTKTKRSIRAVTAALLGLLLLALILALLYHFNFIPHRQYSNADFNIETYISQTDQDGDGIDDQTDILQSTREYLVTKPKYKSQYYATGYPDDHYGVCTDVVAFGLKGAGYDLRELVDADRREHPEDYADEAPDKNIDFRRVRNLIPFFRRHTINLTTDRSNISEWQGGDIVVFKDHIGIISDKRNRHGVPFLIHHRSPFQASYEEDVLENYSQDDIVGHFRMS